MVTVTTYNVYGNSDGTFSGDINPVTNNITIEPTGPAIISIDLDGVTDGQGNPVKFASPPLKFCGSQPGYICWGVMSATLLLIGDINYNNQPFSFTLATDPPLLGDPTIVNTYQPPPGDVDFGKECDLPVPAKPRRAA
jgi:hypothetical protein